MGMPNTPPATRSSTTPSTPRWNSSRIRRGNCIRDKPRLRATYRTPGARSARKVDRPPGPELPHFHRDVAVLRNRHRRRGRPGGRVAPWRPLLLPDRPGNNQIDSLQNVVEQPRLGLLIDRCKWLTF